MRWSYDALWTAANAVAIVKDGNLTPSVSYELTTHEAQEMQLDWEAYKEALETCGST